MPGNFPILCYVTDRSILPAAPEKNSLQALLKKIEQAAAGGIDWIQLREKDLSGNESAVLVREALKRVTCATSASGASGCTTRILVNDRLDVAIAERAAGVHLGENSLPVAEARRLIAMAYRLGKVGASFLPGVSCHSDEAARAAAKAGADYLIFGPVFATPSKVAYGTPQGLDLLASVCRSVKIPVLAIGGVTLQNAHSCFKAGAAGIAAIRLFQEAADIPQVINDLHQLTGKTQ